MSLAVEDDNPAKQRKISFFKLNIIKS